MEKDFYTVKEFAKEYGCSTDRAYEWLRAGKIKYYERLTPHSIYRIPKTELGRLKREPPKLPSQELGVPEEKQLQPLTTKALEEHFEHLAEMAQLLLASNLDKVMSSPIIGEESWYCYVLDDDWKEQQIHEGQLAERLENNISNVIMKYGEWEFWHCFMSHLQEEYPDLRLRELSEVTGHNAFQLIETLRMLAQRKTFKGICPVCKDWR